MKKIRLFENRNGKRGVWALPVATAHSGPSTLPAAVRHAAKQAIAASGDEDLEIHAVHQWRTERPNWNRGEAQWEIFRSAPGLLLLQELGDNKPELSLSMHYAKLLAGLQTSSRPVPVKLMAAPATWAMTSWYPAPAAVEHRYMAPGAFGAAPREARAGYGAAYKEMSKRLQKLLREWVPPHAAVPGGIWDTPGSAAALLAWTAARPVTGEHVDELSPNVMLEYLIGRSLRSAEQRMSRTLQSLSAPMADAPAAIVRIFQPDNAKRVMEMAVREMPLLLQLYQAESRLVESVVLFCAHSQEHVEALQNLPEVENRESRVAVELLWRECVNAVRRFPGPEPAYPLLNRLLIAALDVLEEAAGNGGNTHQVNYPYAA